jgi:hypothetical protein
MISMTDFKQHFDEAHKPLAVVNPLKAFGNISMII